MLNRGAVILKYKEPAIRWVNEADPVKEDRPVRSKDLENERTVYLVDVLDVDGKQAVEEWIAANFKTLFEDELESWYTDTALWPKTRTITVFREWFDVEYHSVIRDTVGGPVFDDEA